MALWPRFQHVMSLHIESLKRMTTNKSAINAVKDIHPHYVSSIWTAAFFVLLIEACQVTRRYAEFATSLLVLNEGYDDAILINR